MPQISMAVVEAIVAGAFLGSLADWLFAGILFHGRCQRRLEAWREGGERGRIIGAQAFALVTSAAFIWLASKTGQTDIRGACMLAVLVWLVGPLPLLVTNHLFVKIDAMVTASHALGWLIKLLLIAATASFFVPAAVSHAPLDIAGLRGAPIIIR